MIRFLMVKNGFEVESYKSAEDFFLSKKFHEHGIYLIDIGLPGIKGEDVIKTIRSRDKISPIFIVSGNHDLNDITRGLESGADDYLLKPFNPDHLLTKVINAKNKTALIIKNMMNVGIKLIPEANSVMRDGTALTVTSREFKIVSFLLQNENKIISREELVTEFDDQEITVRTIDVHISSLRKKLDKVHLAIETVRGQGYKIIV